MTWVGVARLVAAAGVAVLVAGCTGGADDSAASPKQASPGQDSSADTGKQAEPVRTREADWQGVADTLGRTGELETGSVYRVSFPRRDLQVTSKGVEIEPGLSLGSYAAFARYDDGTTVVMGDLVVTEEELPKVTDALQRNGIAQTALHKHLLDHEPPVWWTHFHAETDDPEAVARGIKQALDATATPPPAKEQQPGQLELDTAAIDQALGAKGTNDGGIYKFSFARTETITARGKILPPAMGVTTAINFQPTGNGRAAINGDFAMTADEVQNVIQALRDGGIEIVELHNHALNGKPRLFYMHFWANDDATDLAQTLRKAVDAHDVKPAN